MVSASEQELATRGITAHAQQEVEERLVRVAHLKLTDTKRHTVVTVYIHTHTQCCQEVLLTRLRPQGLTSR